MTKRILLSFGVTIGLFIVFEMVTRFVSSSSDDAHFQAELIRHVLNSQVDFANEKNAHPQLGFQHSPHSTREFSTPEYTYTVKTNAVGLRTKEFTTKREGELRIVLLGDSNFWGVGSPMAQSIEGYVQDALTKKVDGLVNVYTLAVPGYSTVQELALLEAYGALIQPDLIVMGFFTGNDLLPNFVSMHNEDGLYALNQTNTEWLSDRVVEEMGVLWYSAFARHLSKPAFAPRIRYRIAKDPKVRERNQSLLLRAKNLSKTFDASMAVVLLHPADAIHGGWRSWWTKSRETGDLYLKICQDIGLQCIDQRRWMSGADDRRRYFYRNDKHPTPLGNQRLAEMILEDTVTPYLAHFERAIRGVGPSGPSPSEAD